MKTIKEWLSELPEAEAALINLDPTMANEEVHHPSIALIRAFTWYETPQGFEHWDSIYEREKTRP